MRLWTHTQYLVFSLVLAWICSLKDNMWSIIRGRASYVYCNFTLAF